SGRGTRWTFPIQRSPEIVDGERLPELLGEPSELDHGEADPALQRGRGQGGRPSCSGVLSSTKPVRCSPQGQDGRAPGSSRARVTPWPPWPGGSSCWHVDSSA